MGPWGSSTLLIPPDRAADANGPTEIYLLQLTAVAPAITRADDSRVVQALDQQVTEQFPFLQRIGEPEALATESGPAVGLAWEGTAPTGLALRARAFAVVSRGVRFQLLGLGARDPVVARDATLRAIFTTFAPAEGERDPALVGAWRYGKNESLVSGNFTEVQTADGGRVLGVSKDGESVMWFGEIR